MPSECFSFFIGKGCFVPAYDLIKKTSIRLYRKVSEKNLHIHLLLRILV
ncbi:hypothetical protein D931_03608 [Enterococcus faecium 13.SD.W.09]|nr:hypothetical protein D931_03608 [Enterococcus faecium 13.SD.W.09]